ncbi:MAG: 3'-5' exonuclease [Clostridia bacterium]|nr:3'-5' exonuclease [Clostridia bacterium]
MIIYLDTETSGLRPGQICQLSYVMQDRENTFAKNFFFTVDSVEYGAYMIHGFSVEKLKSLSKGKRFSDCVDEIKKDFESCDLLVAHNTSFDMMFLRAEFERVGEILPIKKDFCSMKSTTPICKLAGRRDGYKYPKLTELCAYFKISNRDILDSMKILFKEKAGFHDARFDTTAVYLAMNIGMETERELFSLKEYL